MYNQTYKMTFKRDSEQKIFTVVPSVEADLLRNI